MSTSSPAPASRRFLIIAGSVLGIGLLLVLAYVVLAPGDAAQEDLVAPIDAPQSTVIEEADTVVVEEPTDYSASLVVSRRDPFEPLVEEGDTSASTDTPAPDKSQQSSNPPKSQQTTVTKQPATKRSEQSTPVVSEPRQNDPAPEPDDPQPIVPEPIGGPAKDGEELLVRVIEVQPELMTARVNGERTKLYLNEPNEFGGLTYLAPLGGGCAWVGMPDTEVRFSVCKGKTERL